jgi:hypothetical protein
VKSEAFMQKPVYRLVQWRSHSPPFSLIQSYNSPKTFWEAGKKIYPVDARKISSGCSWMCRAARGVPLISAIKSFTSSLAMS